MTKILVVEDEESIRTTIVDILEDLADFDVLTSIHGKDALEVIPRFHPDLIISDVNMPEMDGFEMLVNLRRNPRTQTIPFIFLTAKAEREASRYGMSIGADDYLTKPFTADELLKAVNSRLERFKVLQESVNAQVEQLQLLRQMDQELSERLEPTWVINMIFDWALRQSNANNAFLFLRETEQQPLKVRYVYGQLHGFEITLDQIWQQHPLTDGVLLSGQIVVIQNVEQLEKYSAVLPLSKSVLAVPIIFQDGVVMGVIALESQQANMFDQTTANLLLQMSNRASVALQHAQLFKQLVTQREAESNLRTLFQKFVSEEVATALEHDAHTTRERNTKVAILFCDIRGFTTYSENHSASEVVSMLNQYIPVVVRAARMYGGNVNKFGGDSVMIIFGAPNKIEEPSYQAVQAALQILRALPHLNETVLKDSDFKLNVGIGINTGDVIAGTIGSDDRQEYTVIGDNVNLAARIESLNKQFTQHSIFITDATYHDLGSRQKEFAIADLGEIVIRGKANPVQVLAVDDHELPR